MAEESENEVILEITPHQGPKYRIEVQDAQFVNTCPHCDEEFVTPYRDKRHPNDSHRQMAFQILRLARDPNYDQNFKARKRRQLAN